MTVFRRGVCEYKYLWQRRAMGQSQLIHRQIHTQKTHTDGDTLVNNFVYLCSVFSKNVMKSQYGYLKSRETHLWFIPTSKSHQILHVLHELMRVICLPHWPETWDITDFIISVLNIELNINTSNFLQIFTYASGTNCFSDTTMFTNSD